MFSQLSWAIAAAVVIAVVVWKLMFRRPPAEDEPESNAMLVSLEQRTLFQALHLSVGDDYSIFGPLRTGDFTGLGRDSSTRRLKPPRLAPLAMERPLFALCRKECLTPIAAVGFQPHSQRHQRATEDDLRHHCDAIGLPLVLLDPAFSHGPAELRRLVNDAISATVDLDRGPDGRREPSISSLDDLDLG